MPTIAEVRQKYPQYSDMSDGDLAGALHAKYYSDMPRAEFDKKVGLSADEKIAPEQQKFDAEPADHGLAERQKLSAVEKAINPITSYPATYDRMNKEARHQVSEGLDEVANSPTVGGKAWGAGKAALGAVGYVASPINAAYRSIVGQPVEDVTGIPREYTEFAAQLATPGIGFTGKAPTPSVAPAKTLGPGQEVVQAATRSVPEGTAVTQAATRLADVTGAPVNVPLAISSDSTAVQRIGQGIKNIPVVGDQIPQAMGRLVEDLGGSVQSVANQFGAGSGPNVANRIGRVIGEAADAETAAARNAAQRSDAAVLADWQRSTDDAGNVISSRETAALQRARDAVGDMSPQDMGANLIARLRAGEQEARATKDRLYGIAGNSDASVRADAVSGIRSRVAQTLENDGRVIDGVLTPASSRMMDELQRLSGLNIENRAVGARVPVAGGEAPTRAAVSAQGIEQVRKRLNAMSQAATNDADRSAARQIIREFDNWQSDAFDSALFSGSDEALSAFRQARAANTEWRQRFGFNARDDADRIVNRIVTGEVTPQEVSNWLVGASQVGAKGVSSRLLTRIAEATGGDAEAMQAIRGGVWNRLSQATEGATAKAPERVASGINEFLNGSGRDVANRLFTAEQRGIMSAYADTLRRGDQARTMLAEVARNTKPQAMEVGIGPMQDLANTVLGRGGKTDEALFAAINAYARSGGRGDIATLSRIMRAIPQQDKGDLAGAIVSGIGTSPRTGQFSTDVFASQWQTYTPQAKTILFGNAGAHRQALDDIATISTRLKEVGQRYGNPSGTAQTRNIFTLAGGLMFAPGVTIPAALGGAVGAHILASPAGASSAARWMKSYEAVAKAPSSRTIAAYTIASRNLVNTARSVGGVSAEHDVLRAIQGPVQGRAQNEQPEPERVINR